MTLKSSASVAAMTLILGFTPALAQTTPTAPKAPAASEAAKAPVSGQITVQDANTILSNELVGQTVYAPDKTKIGTISDLILSKDGKTVEGFLVGVGGFLGIGEKSVAMKMDRLKIAQGGDGTMQLSMDAKKEELSNAPSFTSRKDQEAEMRAKERAAQQPARPTSPAPRN